MGENMEKTKSIIQYVASITILIVCAIICLTCLLMTVLQILYGGIVDLLLMFISAIFLAWSYRKKLTGGEDVWDTCIKRVFCGIGLFLVSILMELCFLAMSATINLDVCSCYSLGYIYICQRCTDNIKSDHCCFVSWNRDLYGLSQ